MNLCRNAEHAVQHKNGQISVRLEAADIDSDFAFAHPPLRPGPHIRLSVTDNGVGMSENTLAHIFDPFFTTKRAGQGTGLGLSTIYSIVKNHHGLITVDSAVGKGSTFCVYLPEIDRNSDHDIAIEVAVPGGKEHILLVDDQTRLLRAATRLLEPLGYRVTALSNAFEAWLKFRENPDHFDIVITDQTMPEMTGTELAREILEMRPGFPIILMSGYGEATDPGMVAELGIAKYLHKPTSKQVLGTAIRELLDRSATNS